MKTWHLDRRIFALLFLFAACDSANFVGQNQATPGSAGPQPATPTDLDVLGEEPTGDDNIDDDKDPDEEGEDKGDKKDKNSPPIFLSVPGVAHNFYINDPEQLVIKGILRDFKAEHPDFEVFTSATVTPQTVENVLGGDGKPVYGPNGARTITSPDTLAQWFRDVPGVNQRFLHDIVLTKQSSGIYSYFSDAFFPLDGRGFGNEGNTNNFHFTFEVETRFTYNGGETFTFSGDDDVFVFINGSMALDLGGTHPIATGTISLDTLGLTVGQSYPLKLFFAERHTNKSNFRIDTTIEFLQNKAYEYIVKGVDPDGDPITYILKSGPKGMTIDSKTGLIQWEVDEAHVGRHRVVVHLDDGKNEPVEQSFVLNIRSPR